MKRLFRFAISVSMFILFATISLYAQQTKVYKNIYQPLKNKGDYPKVLSEVDKKLQEFYSKTYPSMIADSSDIVEYFSSMDSTEFMQ